MESDYGDDGKGKFSKLQKHYRNVVIPEQALARRTIRNFQYKSIARIGFSSGEAGHFAQTLMERGPQADVRSLLEEIGPIPEAFCKKEVALFMRWNFIENGRCDSNYYWLLEVLLDTGCSPELLAESRCADPEFWRLLITYGFQPVEIERDPRKLLAYPLKALSVLIPSMEQFPIRLYNNISGAGDIEYSPETVETLANLLTADSINFIPTARQFTPQLIYWLLRHGQDKIALRLLELPANRDRWASSELASRALNELLSQPTKESQDKSQQVETARRLIDAGSWTAVDQSAVVKKLTFRERMKMWGNRITHPLKRTIRSAWRRFKSLFST
jgi:hypothetical protein